MNTERWQRVGDIFERLLEVPLDQRESELEGLCGADDELRGIVISMLDSREGRHLSDDSIATQLQNSRVSQAASVAIVTPRADEAAGSRIGHWRLVRRIGAGGMGVVWLAERADGHFRQRAALKLIKRGMDSDAVLARFLRERQILAKLEHRNIAHLLDGGIAADGRPYFAMEYVEGEPLLEYCSKHGLGLEQRLSLFLQVCSAVRFAHSQHIVHRDIKPSNVLVTADGSVKLLDFGIAKMLQGDGELDATLTATHREQPMTPAYAAPEQFTGNEVTEATDVYALGCVFYELLSGRRPHDFSAAADPRDVLKIILATDPVAPGKLKQSSAPVPAKQLRGDLDTIALTATRHETARRYPTVAAFAADIGNYLEAQPIAARRDHFLYRGLKFVRRHRAAAQAAAIVACVVAAAFAFVLMERRPPPPGSSLAVGGFANATRAAEVDWLPWTLRQMLGTELAQDNGLHVVADDVARDVIAALPSRQTDGYSVSSLAGVRERLGADYVLSGAYFVSGAGGDATLRLDLSLQDTRGGAAFVTEQTGTLADLPRLVQQGGAELRAKLGFAPRSEEERSALTRAQPPSTDVAKYIGVALQALRQHDPARANEALQKAVAIAPGYAPANAYRAEALKMLGYDAKALAAAEQASEHLDGLPEDQQLRIRRQLALQKLDWPTVAGLDSQLLARDPRNGELHLARVRDLIDANHAHQAEVALAELRELPGMRDEPRVELLAVNLAHLTGDSRGQATHAERALQLAEARDAPALRADAAYDLAIAREALGDGAAAERQYRRAITDYAKVGNPAYEGDAHVRLATLLRRQGGIDAATREYEAALALFQRTGNRRGMAQVYSNLAGVHWTGGDHDAAETAAHLSQQIFREIDDGPGKIWSLYAFAFLRNTQATTDSVVDDFREAVHLSDKEGSRDDHAYVVLLYSDALRLRGRLAESRENCDSAVGAARRMARPELLGTALNYCIRTMWDQGDEKAASAAYEEITSIANASGDPRLGMGVAMARARQDILDGKFTDARSRLRGIAPDLLKANTTTEATAQALLALCEVRLNDVEAGEAARERAAELRRRITVESEMLQVDSLLLQAKGWRGDRGLAARELQVLADDAERRHWLPDALDARSAAWQLLEAAHDPAAATLRTAIRTVAKQHGFGSVLQRVP